jgi:MFS family permease
VVTALRPEASPAGLSRRRHAMGFWLAGYVFAITIAFSAVPAPLYVLYQARDHFGPPLVTIIFSVYALGVAASLFGVGHVSDWLGRRRILLLAVVINMASGLLFLLWPTVPGLIIGRIVSGVSIGMLTATATAYLSELHVGARPGAPRTPGFLADTLHDRSHALAGAATFIVFGAAALAQIGTSRASLQRQLGLGLGLLVLGLVLVTVAIWNPSLPLLLAGGALGGAGAGAVFKGGISAVLEIAPEDARGEALAGLFLAAYLGLAIPVIALGFASQALSPRTALLGFSVLLAVVIALVARKLLGRRPA